MKDRVILEDIEKISVRRQVEKTSPICVFGIVLQRLYLTHVFVLARQPWLIYHMTIDDWNEKTNSLN